MKRLCVLLIVLMLLLPVSGCGDKMEEKQGVPVSLVIIAGRHANANMFTEDMLETVRFWVNQTIQEKEDSKGYHAEADISIIVCDGDPRKVPVESDGRNLLKVDAPNSKKYEEGKEKIADKVIEFLTNEALKADDPEVDLLKAVSQAQDILNSRKNTEHHILILDTGITTSGYLDMRRVDFINTDTTGVLAAIQEGIPNLTGTKITFLGIGNVSSNQPELSSKSSKDRLVTLWTAIFESAGGELTDTLYISENYGSPMEFSEDGTGYPPVGTVFFPQPDGTISCTEILIDTKVETAEPIIAAKFHTSDLGFVPNEATFRDVNQAHHAINTIAPELQRFLNETNYKIYVVGSIAKISPDRSDRHNETSKKRAQAVADMLIREYGVPAERIIVIDAGVTEFSWRNANEDDGPQQANRVVAIISENTTDLVQELRNAGYID